jgi:hypothetical protein
MAQSALRNVRPLSDYSISNVLDQYARQNTSNALGGVQERFPQSSPVEQEVYKLTGMQPGLDRAAILPIAGSRDQGNLQFAAPQFMYDAAKAFVSPGVAASGREVSLDDTVNTAMALGGMNAPAGIATAAAAAPGEVVLGSFGSAVKQFPQQSVVPNRALRDVPRINEEESIGLRAAQNTLARNQQDIIDSAIETVREEGINVESLISDPKYWDAENEQFTDRGFIEYDRLIETEGKRRANIRAVESLADLNDASHDAQADAFYAIAELRGLNPSVDYSFGGSIYITLQDGTKFRFANHGNTVRDTSMQPDVNVAPDYSTFTDALKRLPSAEED